MNGRNKKTLAIAAVAMFCLSAVAVVLAIDDSSADDEKKTYNMFVEIINADGHTVAKTTWVRFTCDATNESLVEEASKAIAATPGLEKMSITLGKYGPSVSYTGGHGSSCFYEKDGDWARVSKGSENYLSTTTIGFAVNYGYIDTATYEALTTEQKALWTADPYPSAGWEYYLTAPAAKVSDVPELMERHLYVEIINAEGKVDTTKWIEYDSYKTLDGFISATTLALAANELDKVKATESMYGGVWWTYDGAGLSTSYYAKDGEWKSVEDTTADYVNNDTISLATNHGTISKAVFDALSSDEQKNWKYTEWGGDYDYAKIITESTTGYKPAEKNNLVLYIVIGVVAVVAIAAIAFFLMKKKA